MGICSNNRYSHVVLSKLKLNSLRLFNACIEDRKETIREAVKYLKSLHSSFRKLSLLSAVLADMEVQDCTQLTRLASHPRAATGSQSSGSHS
eukprot:1157012-Pelagomonas_calceolata.AAC.3